MTADLARDPERETRTKQRQQAMDAFEAALLRELRRRQPDSMDVPAP